MIALNIQPYQIPPSVQESQAESPHSSLFAIHSLQGPAGTNGCNTWQLCKQPAGEQNLCSPSGQSSTKKGNRYMRVFQLREWLISYSSNVRDLQHRCPQTKEAESCKYLLQIGPYVKWQIGDITGKQISALPGGVNGREPPGLQSGQLVAAMGQIGTSREGQQRTQRVPQGEVVKMNT